MLKFLRKTFLRKRLLFLLLGAIGEICLKVASNSSFFAEEVFGKHIFKWFSHAIAFLTGWVPFSVAEMSAFLAPVLLLVVLTGFIIKFIRSRKERLFLVFTFVINTLCVASAVWFFYCFGCGINYYRYTVSDYTGYVTRPSSKEELALLLGELADEVRETREALDSFDETGAFVLPYSYRELGEEARKAFDLLAEDYPIYGGDYPAPKCVLHSHLMSNTRIIGIYTCWTMEANVDVDIPDYEIGATMCHELSHLRGFIREDEANFIAYLACMKSDCKELRYSGAMSAFTYTANALAAKDPDLYVQVMQEHYSEGMWYDFDASRQYWKQFEKTEKVAEITDELNDTYLKANNQEDGVESYGRVVDLLLAKYRKDHGIE